ncbi:MAG: indolepyruvate ferredoxin oxidoreductase subunit alpha [Anaerofustis sp.]
MKELLTGNEAIAQAAYDAGVQFASAYPGTPSTEILENISAHKDIYAEWAPNEKVALEGAIGASYAGARAIASMKHVGLNVAADPFFTNAYTGVNAGLVVVTADEPGVHSSQNEQDNRRYAYHANVPLFEPSDSQEAYDMVMEAYRVSETFDTPVLIRMTTRVCHSKSIVELKERVVPPFKSCERNPMKYIPVPAVAKNLKIKVLQRAKQLEEYTEKSEFNFAEYNDKKIGFVASGIAYQYVKEVFGNTASYYKVGFSHPLPIEELKKFASQIDKLYVLEENDPVMEIELKAAGIAVIGKELFPSDGELTPDVIRKSFFGNTLDSIKYDKTVVPPRAPALCAGCPHRGMFYALGKRKNLMLSGDIGCYTLGFAAPYNAMDTTICMGASISAAHGAQKMFDRNPDSDMRAVAIIGDSTYFHTGINSLMNVAYNNSKVITIILDNRITGMTGHQQNPGTGYTAQEDPANLIDIEKTVRALGITNIKTINPNHLNEVNDALDWALALNEPSVIITRYPCALKKFSKEDKAEFDCLFTEKFTVDENKCIGCKLCLKAGCPAISFDDEAKKAQIDKNACVGCGVCAQVCTKQAILNTKEVQA